MGFVNEGPWANFETEAPDTLENDSVGTNQLVDLSVTTQKIANGSVTTGKLSSALRLSNMRTFDTVAAMQAATDLEAGMTCHTNGFHSAGDGGAAYYTVSESGTANDMNMLALQDSLLATMVVTEPYVTPEMYGAYGDGATDDADVIQAAIDSGYPVKFSPKTYGIETTITLTGSLTLPTNAVIKALANMTSVITFGTLTSDAVRLIGGTYDANQLADYCIYAGTFTGQYIQNVRCLDATQYCIYIVGGNHSWIVNSKLYNQHTLAGGIYNNSNDLKIEGSEIYYTSCAVMQMSSIICMTACHLWCGGATNPSQTTQGVVLAHSSNARGTFVNVYFDSFNKQIEIPNTTGNVSVTGCIFYWAGSSPASVNYGIYCSRTNAVINQDSNYWYSDSSLTDTIQIYYGGTPLDEPSQQKSIASYVQIPQGTQVVGNTLLKDHIMYLDFIIDVSDNTQVVTDFMPLVTSTANNRVWVAQRMDFVAFNVTQGTPVQCRIDRQTNAAFRVLGKVANINNGDRVAFSIACPVRF